MLLRIKAKANHSAKHSEWLSGINEHQQRLYLKLQASKNASGANPLIESANMASDLLEQIENAPDNEQFDAFTVNEDNVKRIKEMYIESIGIKM